jgi:hypothetical protein
MLAAVRRRDRRGIQVHLDRDVGFLQGGVVDERLLHAIDIVVFRLQQEGRWRPFGDGHVGVQRMGFGCQVARVDRQGEVRACAFLVGDVDGVCRGCA